MLRIHRVSLALLLALAVLAIAGPAAAHVAAPGGPRRGPPGDGGARDRSRP